MTHYQFGGMVPLAPIRAQRIENEREAERVHNDFSHQINPLRGFDDFAVFKTIVRTPKSMTDIQTKAFEYAMNYCLEHFTTAFENNLRELQKDDPINP